MAWQDFTPVDISDYMTPNIILQAYDYQLYLAEKMKEISGAINLEPIDMSKGISEYGRTSIINTIENNIKTLVGKLFVLMPDYIKTKLWYGAGRDTPKLNYIDVNRWFSDMGILDDYIETMKSDFLYSGTFYPGSDRTTQHFNRIWVT